MAAKKDGLKESEVKGYIRLFKNDKMIREKLLHRKSVRKEYLNQYLQIAKESDDGIFEIRIELNI